MLKEGQGKPLLEIDHTKQIRELQLKLGMVSGKLGQGQQQFSRQREADSGQQSGEKRLRKVVRRETYLYAQANGLSGKNQSKDQEEDGTGKTISVVCVAGAVPAPQVEDNTRNPMPMRRALMAQKTRQLIRYSRSW